MPHFYRKVDSHQRAVSHYKRGGELYAEGKIGEALTAFDDATKVQKDLADAYFMIGRIYLDRGKEKKAGKAFKKYLKYLEKSIKPEAVIGFLEEEGLLNEEELLESRDRLRILLADPEYHLYRGKMFLSQGKNGFALSALRQGLELDPENVGLQRYMGRALYEKGRYPEAVSFFTRVTADSGVAQADDFTFLGDCLRNLKRFPEAISAYKEGVSKNPKNGYLRVGMAICYLSVGKAMEAFHVLNENIKKNPDYPYSYFFRGVILEKEFQNNPEALRAYRRFVELMRGQKNVHTRTAEEKIGKIRERMKK